MDVKNIIKNIDNLSKEELLKIAKTYKINIKSKKERLIDALQYLSTEYIPYPQINDKDFFRKIYEKKEFYQNKYQKFDTSITDTQKEYCPSKEKKFQLLPHQIILRNYMNFHTPYNGVLLFHGLGSGKCHAIDTPILMANGLIKKVQDIKVGEFLMGDDSTKRKVLSLGRGKDTMYDIIPIKGDKFTVNSEHILCLKISNDGVSYVNDKRTKSEKKYCATYIDKNTYKRKSKYFKTKKEGRDYLNDILKKEEDKIMEISVKDYIELPKNIRSKLKLYRKPVDFKSKKVEFDPYIIGFWIGDGSKRDPVITTQDSKVISYLKKTLPKYNLMLNYQSGYDYRISSIKNNKNKMLTVLKKENLINNKHIPDIYKINSREVRLQVLAGLIDSDGSYQNGVYEFTQKKENIMDDTIYLARSLGFSAYKKVKKTSWTYKGVKKFGIAYRINISGDIDQIPVKLTRKIARKREQKKDVLVTGFKVEEKDIDNYYGFTIDRNNRYLMGDFTVTHNTCSSITIAESYKKTLNDISQNKTLVLVSGNTIEENFIKEIHNIEKGYNQCTFTDYKNYNPYDSKKVKQEKVNNLISKNYELEHYQRLSNIIGSKKKELTNEEFKKWIEQTYSNRVFIIDEVHNLKLKDKKDEINTTIKRYDAVMLILKYSKNIKLVLLSGTPMSHTATEIVDLLNLLLINDNYTPIKIKSIFDSNHEITEAGKVILRKVLKVYSSYIIKENPFTFPEKRYPEKSVTVSDFIDNKFDSKFFSKKESDEFQIVPCVMSVEQRKQYLSYLNQKEINIQNVIQLGLISYDYKKKDSIYNIAFDKFSETNIQKISTKFYKLLQNIKQSDGPIFIYSNYKEKGIYMIASMLLKNGIDIYNSRKDGVINPLFSKKFTNKRIRPNDNKKICAICTNKKNGEHIGHSFTPMLFDFIIGKTPDEVQKAIIKKFNDPDNIKGDKLKIIIGSSVLKEGVSFLKIRQLHIMEPWHNKSRLQQVIGRGLRHCSHKSLAPKDRNIEIYLYASILDDKYKFSEKSDKKTIVNKMNEIFKGDIEKKIPIEYAKPIGNADPFLAYDIIMFKRAELLNVHIKKVELLLKESAFDCALHKELNINTLSKEEQYVCSGFDKDYKYDLKESDVDFSTYDNVFLTPYIKYTISIITQFFENNNILYDTELQNHSKLQEKIYKENNYYILRKALDMIVPKNDDMSKFAYIITNKNKFAYIFSRNMEDKKIYILKFFENQNIFKRSIFEVYPIYEKLYEETEPVTNSFKLFLNILERKEKKKRGETFYFNTLTKKTQHKKFDSGKHITGNVALEEIKRLDPITNHKKDGEYVGITFKSKIYQNKMWIRKTESNKNKRGENIKQYSYGQECILTFTRDELTNIVTFLWNKVDTKGKFFKDNSESFSLVINNQKPMKFKENKCDFIKLIMIHLNNKKVDGKVWYKEL